MKPVAIIGGGITGLTAAFTLEKLGIQCTLYEADNRIGGVIQTVRDGAYLAECGPNTILETSPLVGELIRDLDLQDRRVNSSPQAENRYIIRGKRLVKLPSSPLEFLTSPLFSWRAKARILAEPFIRRAPSNAEENLETFVRRRIGQEFLDYAINPLVAGIYAGSPVRLSVRHAFPKLHILEQRYGSLIGGQILGARERKRRGVPSKKDAPKFSFDEGLQTLTDALGQRLKNRIQTGRSVHKIHNQGGSWRLAHGQESVLSPVDYSAVLLALPSFRMARLEVSCESQDLDLSMLEGIHYTPVTSVVLGFCREDVDHPLDGFGALIPEVEGLDSLGVIFSSSLFPGRAPEGHVLLTSYVGGMRAPDLAGEGAEKCCERVIGDLRVVLGLKGEPTFRHTFFYPRAIPQYDVGFGRFKARMEELEKEGTGLFFAGHCRDGVSLADSISSGSSIANRIAVFLKK